MSSSTAIVIGTGVAGASTGFALARRGVKVTFVESGFEAPATAAGAGIIQPWSSAVDGEYYSYYAAGADFYEELIARLSEVGVDDIGYRRSGALVVNRDAAMLDEVEERVESRIGDALLAGDVSRVSNSSAKELFPPLGDGFEGIYISGGARVDGRVLRRGLLAAVESFGGRIIDGTAAIDATSDGRRALTFDGRRVEADRVVLATGVWTNRILEPLVRCEWRFRSGGSPARSRHRRPDGRPVVGDRLAAIITGKSEAPKAAGKDRHHAMARTGPEEWLTGAV